MFEIGPWTKYLPLLLWITGIVGAWIALLLRVIRSLLQRSVKQIDDQFLELRKRLETLEASLSGTSQKVTSLELKLQQEISALREEIQGGYLRKEEWLRDERHREEAARRLSARMEALEESVRNGRTAPPLVPWPYAYSQIHPFPTPQPLLQPGERAPGA
ncbi:MAG: hypothetical protein HYZ13_09250 [Acidobacteria bacterium]|nr:hypothetical protein [Acidobacteriota bacterium]